MFVHIIVSIANFYNHTITVNISILFIIGKLMTWGALGCPSQTVELRTVLDWEQAERDLLQGKKNQCIQCNCLCVCVCVCIYTNLYITFKSYRCNSFKTSLVIIFSKSILKLHACYACSNLYGKQLGKNMEKLYKGR